MVCLSIVFDPVLVSYISLGKKELTAYFNCEVVSIMFLFLTTRGLVCSVRIFGISYFLVLYSRLFTHLNVDNLFAGTTTDNKVYYQLSLVLSAVLHVA